MLETASGHGPNKNQNHELGTNRFHISTNNKTMVLRIILMRNKPRFSNQPGRHRTLPDTNSRTRGPHATRCANTAQNAMMATSAIAVEREYRENPFILFGEKRQRRSAWSKKCFGLLCKEAFIRMRKYEYSFSKPDTQASCESMQNSYLTKNPLKAWRCPC